MQPEILRFLRLARDHLREVGTNTRVCDEHADMQAPDRALPDADWFELAEFERALHSRPIDLWG